MNNTRKQPEWLDDAIFYEIYPQSFQDTNADGIGDINGITRRLDYIRGLGCNAIWINPCFQSPFGDAGYDVEDYYTVAPGMVRMKIWQTCSEKRMPKECMSFLIWCRGIQR